MTPDELADRYTAGLAETLARGDVRLVVFLAVTEAIGAAYEDAARIADGCVSTKVAAAAIRDRLKP